MHRMADKHNRDGNEGAIFLAAGLLILALTIGAVIYSSNNPADQQTASVPSPPAVQIPGR